MKVLVIVAACLLSATLSPGQCVIVTGVNPALPTFPSSSRRIHITALQAGSVLFYLKTDEVNPRLAPTGFFSKIVGFEIGPSGEAKDLRVALRIGFC